jgi:hypothetical protein
MRTGDIVRHYPSGEAWVVARVKDGRVYWMGWPAGGSADMSECKLVWTCRDEQHPVVPGRDEPEPEFGLTMFDLDGHEDLAAMARVGKRAAGRLFDGREWDEYPEVDQ